MKSIRIGNDIQIKWPISFDGDASLLEELDLSVEVRLSQEIVDYRNYEESPVIHKCEHTVMSNYGNSMPVQPPHDDVCDGYWHQQHKPERKDKPKPAPVMLPFSIVDNTIIAYWAADKQFAVGEYDIIVSSKKNDIGQCVTDQCRFVRLVAHSAEADAPSDTDVEAVITLQPLTLEVAGMSAYDLAVAEGYSGTRTEWLASLKEPAISAAKEVQDAYETAEAARNTSYEEAEAERNTKYATAEEERNAKYSEAETARNTKYEEAETARVEAETTRESNETTRKANETARQEAESKRDSKYEEAESARNAKYTTAEAKRDSEYKTAETARDEKYATAEANRDTEYSTAEANRDTLYEKAEATREGKLTDVINSANEATVNVNNAVTNANKAVENANEAANSVDTAITNAETATAACKEATDLANELNQHPGFIGEDGYWYSWNADTDAYENTGKVGSVVFPTIGTDEDMNIYVDYETEAAADMIEYDESDGGLYYVSQ